MGCSPHLPSVDKRIHIARHRGVVARRLELEADSATRLTADAKGVFRAVSRMLPGVPVADGPQ